MNEMLIKHIIRKPAHPHSFISAMAPRLREACEAASLFSQNLDLLNNPPILSSQNKQLNKIQKIDSGQNDNFHLVIDWQLL